MAKKKTEFLSKNRKRELVEPNHPNISIQRQCSLLGIPRSTYYFQPAVESEENLALMRLLDEQHTKHPSSGSRTMKGIVEKKGCQVNRKRMQRLMQKMGLLAVYPKKRTTIPSSQHKKYPYLLRNMIIDRPNQVWCTDITYIRMPTGFVYLTAVMDWYSRYILSWRLSNTMDCSFCLEALEEAFLINKPEIFNTDQGVQFTCGEFINALESRQIRVSMDGKGRCMDNIFIERFWRTIKYEFVYLEEHHLVQLLARGIGGYMDYYNKDRPHQGLIMKTPLEVYEGG